jgi:DNA primase
VIPKETVDNIIEAAHVEEVLGEFITLKKRGANLLGLCPFHGEKTPSFTVSPVKGIYKCFGCGKAGNSVNFVMDHLQLTYPEALRWLAKKYGIEVVEKEVTVEEKERQTERESLLIVMQYAQRYFSQMMNETDEGKSIGLGYFLQRELRKDIIEKFNLGYSLEERKAFSNAAAKAGYQAKYLVKTGMSILSNTHVEGNEISISNIFDRYAGRVMFPIQDDGGRVVAFGGRTLSSDKKIAKYINSPETDIYNKSKILYGLWVGKKSIQQNDLCYLVEGYMDVIAMHQAGIENVVASSGTSLTVEQIKSIHRFTKNIIVLYDGDEAGQKASNRAIPLLLEEGMNVRLLFFPDNDDPDSFSRKVTNEEFKKYISTETQDFLYFKAKKILKETKNDPIKKAAVTRDLVENIALIPDNIIRSIYIKECSNIMQIEETILQQEVNKIRRSAGNKQKRENSAEVKTPNEVVAEIEQAEKSDNTLLIEKSRFAIDSEEKELLRIMLVHGKILITIDAEEENETSHEMDITVSEYILFELWRDDIAFENPVHQTVLDEYIHELSAHRLPDLQYFINHVNPIIHTFTINHAVNEYELSEKWKKFGVLVQQEQAHIKRAVQHLLFSLKEKKLGGYIYEKQEELKAMGDSDTTIEIIKQILYLTTLKSRVNKLLGRVVVR